MILYIIYWSSARILSNQSTDAHMLFFPHASYITTFLTPMRKQLSCCISHKMPSTFCVKRLFMFQMHRCVSLSCFENLSVKQCQHTGRRSLLFSTEKKNGKEKILFFLTWFFTLSDSISRSIGISGVTHHEISPILGFQRNSILKTPEICGHIASSSSGQIAILCDSCWSKTVVVVVVCSCVDKLVSNWNYWTNHNWFNYKHQFIL